jgi:hypothetical protein
MLPRIDRREFIRQDEEWECICPKSEEVLKMAGVLTIEEYIPRRRETIMKYAQTRDIYIWEVPKIPKSS